jgi:PAS domain S-box-containing protein
MAYSACLSLPQQLIKALGSLQAHAINAISGSIYIYDLVDQCTICATSSVSAILGYTAAEVEAMGAVGMAGLIHPDDLNRVSDHYQRSIRLRQGEVIEIEYRMQRPDGTWGWLRSQETPLVMASDGFPLQVLGMIQDASQHKQAELWEALSFLIDHRPEMMTITNQAGVITYVNPAFEQITGYSAAEAIGQTPAILKSGQHGTAFYRQLWNTLQAGQVFEAEFINRKKNGDLFCEEKIITPLKDGKGTIHFAASGQVVRDYQPFIGSPTHSTVPDSGKLKTKI